MKRLSALGVLRFGTHRRTGAWGTTCPRIRCTSPG